MISLAILLAIATALFAASFFSKRRFGILGLALMAGYVVSGIWNYDAGLIIASTGLVPDGQITEVVVTVVLILLPSIFLLFTGYKYKSVFSRAVGSLLFAIFGLGVLIGPVGTVLPVEGMGADAYSFLMAQRDVIIGAGVVLAVIDLFLRKSPPAITDKKARRH